MLRNLAALVVEATEALRGYDYARALQRTETFFWRFCDDYLELVKGRRVRRTGPGSGRLRQRRAVDGAFGAAAPLRPVPAVCDRRSVVVVAERIGSHCRLARAIRDRGAARRHSDTARQADQAAYEWATAVLFEVRKQRSEAKQPLKVPITKVTITAEAVAVALMPHVEADLRSALRVQDLRDRGGEPRAFVVAGYEAPAP
jgi:valyl-tRNA synthetase